MWESSWQAFLNKPVSDVGASGQNTSPGKTKIIVNVQKTNKKKPHEISLGGFAIEARMIIVALNCTALT
ncbi:hypothetical protein [Herminiimonas sp. CN]|uniref:hypothetical protein n=1 Tax=Herminiimonas sp. CN TaxID=1349818 RepID=UPI0012DDF09F|nr:hypothetical protein [Herminiimonas sp. CN]